MSTEELFAELHKLHRADKLRAMELLVVDLAAEDDVLLGSQAYYEIWSPFDAPVAAEKLMKLLEDEQEARNG